MDVGIPRSIAEGYLGRISDWCQDVCCICSKATSGWRSRCQWRASLKPCRQTSVQPPATVVLAQAKRNGDGCAVLQGERCRTTGPRLRRPTSGPTPVVSLSVCRNNRLPMQRMWRLCLGPPRGTQGAILTPQRSALCQDLPLAHIYSMLWQVMGAAGRPRESCPSHQCSSLSHYGRAHGKEAGADDETCPRETQEPVPYL